MSHPKPGKREHDHVVWALLFLSEDSEREVRSFVINALGVPSRATKRNLHLTVYHARRRLAGLQPREEKVDITCPPSDWRLMVITPGGENSRPDIDEKEHPLGLRLVRSSDAGRAVLRLREQFYPLETPEVLSGRAPSNPRRSAFGSHHYQPHVTLLRPGTAVAGAIASTGDRIRESLGALQFDRFVVTSKSRSNSGD